MPNWCENILIVGHGDQKMLSRFRRGYESGDLGQEFLPMPAEYHKDEKWHAWRTTHWGTKWAFGQGDHGWPPVEVDGKVEVRFDTAWSAPFEFYLELRRLGYDINATFYEPGMCLCGGVLDDESRVFSIDCWNPTCVRRFIDRDLVELFAIDDGSLYDDEQGLCEHDDKPWFQAGPLAKTVDDRRAFRARAKAIMADMRARRP